MRKTVLLLISNLWFFFAQGSSANQTYNFGLVNFGRTFQIYRSGSLGDHGLFWLSQFFNRRNLFFPRTVVNLTKFGFQNSPYDYSLKEWELKLFFGFNYFHSFDYNYRTYLDEVNPLNPLEDIDEKNFLGEKAKLQFGNDPRDGNDGGVVSFFRVLNLVLNPDAQPVLIEGDNGARRVGMTVLALRMIQGGTWLHNPSDPGFAKPIQIRNRFGELVTHKPRNNGEAEYLGFAGGDALKENLDFILAFQGSSAFQSYVAAYRDALASN